MSLDDKDLEPFMDSISFMNGGKFEILDGNNMQTN
jgi:hypothetical protein